MLNHAAHVNAERTKARVEARTSKNKHQDLKDPIVCNGKRFSEMTEDEKMAYYSTF